MSFIPRIYIESNPVSELMERGFYDLSVQNIHYLGNVLRLKSGDKVILFNNQDGEWLCVFEQVTKNRGRVFIKERLRGPVVVHGPTLLFAPLKRDATDLAVRMATELGVQSIQPVQTARTNSFRIKAERLQTIMVEASEQSDRLSVPELRPMAPLFEVLDSWPENRKILFALERYEERKIAISSLSAYTGDEGMLIGPEGGFDENEVKKLLSYEFIEPLSLGKLVLKAETAIVAGLAKLFPYVTA